MNAIVVVDQKWAIGREGGLLFSLPTDMKRFRSLTLNGTVILGRKTLDTFPGGRPLPKRRNIVISHQKGLEIEGAELVGSLEEALEAVRHGADCLGVGAAFSTHTKADVDVLPEGMMKAICDAVDIPVVAIGGIPKENLLRLKGTGVNGVALVSAIFGAEDIEAECRELKALAEQL